MRELVIRTNAQPGANRLAASVCPGAKRVPDTVKLWVLLALVLSVKAVLLPSKHTTYPCFEAGTLSWWAGENMYDFAACGYEYRYSPTFAVAFTPLAILPIWCGGVAWSLLNAGLLYWALRELIRDVFPPGAVDRQEVLFTVLVAVGSIRGLWSAQSNTLVIALVAGGVAAFARQQLWRAAFLLAIPVFIKVWPLAVVLLLAACWPRQLLLRCGAAIAALAALPFLTKPPNLVLWQYKNWCSAVLGQMNVRHDYRDVWTLWEWLAPPVQPAAYFMVQMAAAAAVLALCLWQKQTAPSTRHALTFILGIWTAWQLAFGPGTERNTFCLIAPLIAWGMITALKDRPSAPFDRLLMACAFGLTTLFTFGIFERKLVEPIPATIAALPIGILLFAAWLILHARRAGEKGRERDARSS